MSWDMLYHVIRWNVKDPIRLLKPVIQFVLSVAEKTSRVVRRRFFFSNRRSAPRPFKDIFSAESLASEEIYSRDTKTHVSGLSREESARFENNGWIGPFTFLEPKGIQIIGKIHDQVVRKFNSPGKKYAEPGFILKHPWIKSMHAYVPEFYDITRHPAIVNRVASILGPDIIVWGFSMNEYPPGKVHRWHVDIEHRRWRGVTVFLGLRNITMESTLKVISASHRIKELPQNIGARDDESALALALRYEKASELVPVPVGEGDFFIFDGLLWHGSKNRSYRTRSAIIIQYSRPDQRVEVPLDWDGPIPWAATRPPCTLVSGEDRWGINQLVNRPAGSAWY